MGSTKSFVDYVRDQVSGAGPVTFKQMFGEWALYLDGKIVALVCDDRLLVKPTPGGRALLGSVVEEPPYPGARPYFLIQERIEDRTLVSALLQLTANELPAPTPKRAKAGNKKQAKRKKSR